MNPLVICCRKTDLIPCIVNVALGDIFQALQITLINQLLYVWLGFVFDFDCWIITLGCWGLTISTQMLHMLVSALVLCTKFVSFHCATFDKGHKHNLLDILAHSSFVFQVPKEAGALNFDKVLQQ